MKLSDQGFAHAIELLDTPDHVGPQTKLVPEEVCTYITDEIERAENNTRHQAIDLASRLLGRYPDASRKALALGYWAVFTHHPWRRSLRAIDALHRTKITAPTVNALIKVLATEQARDRVIVANAKSHMLERERRFEQRRVQEEWNRARPPLAARRRQVEMLLGKASKSL